MTQDEAITGDEDRIPKRVLPPEFGICSVLGMFFLPMKAFHLTLGGLSVYVPYLAILIVLVFSARPLIELYLEYFLKPTLVLFGFTLFYFVRTGLDLSIFVFTLKIVMALAMVTLYQYLLSIDERRVMQLLEWGIKVTVAYMIYQSISFTFFGLSLPFTSISMFGIGRGLSNRFGLNRVTGFTEEPSFVAVMLIGSLFLFHSFQKRSGISQMTAKRACVVGLLLSTSNNVFAAIPLVLIYSMFYKMRKTWMFFIAFYAANLIIYPYVLNIDDSFFARFSSYSLFAAEPWDLKIFGIGFNQYSRLDLQQYVSPLGLPGIIVDSLGSLWGGLLLEGGILFTTCFCLYFDRLVSTAKDNTGYALMVILIMLANYYSPWWPITSFALAYVLHSHQAYSAVDFIGARQQEVSKQIGGEPVFE